MVWAKTPIAASSILCAACLVAAAALPFAGDVAKTVEADVNLADVNYGNLAGFNAIPAYQTAAAGDPTALFALSSLSGIPAYLLFGLTNNVAAFSQTDTNAGLAALSGLETLQTAQASGNPEDLAGIDAFSAIPALNQIGNGDPTGLASLDSTNGIVALAQYAATQNTDAFIQSDTNIGYAALSGLSYYRNAQATGDVNQLAGIDAFSALPALQTLFSGNATEAEIAAAQRSLASVSAIPEYQGQPVPDPDADDATTLRVANNVVEPADTQEEAPAPAARSFSKLAAAPSTPAVEEETTPQVEKLSAPEEVVTPAAATPPADPVTPPVKKPGNGSYSKNFSPVGLPVLFGSGGGKGSADNGMRGYGSIANGLRGALGMGPDNSGAGGDAG